MSNIHTHYDNLGVSRNADPAVIKAAYKVLAQKYHPDRNPGNTQAAYIMQLINKAYEVLSDPQARAEHDQWILEQELLEELKLRENTVSDKSIFRNQQYKYNNSASEGLAATNRYLPKLYASIQQFKKVIIKLFLGFKKLWFFIPLTILIALIFGMRSKPVDEAPYSAYEVSDSYYENTEIGYDSYTDTANLGADYEYTNSEYTNIDSDISNPLTPEPLPYTGYSNQDPLSNASSPLQIHTSHGSNYWIKITDAYSSNEIISYFIRGGDTLNVELPTGAYKIKYASGDTWYGEDSLFGTETQYAEANETFNFTFNGYQYSGYTIELIPQTSGNLSTSIIDANDF